MTGRVRPSLPGALAFAMLLGGCMPQGFPDQAAPSPAADPGYPRIVPLEPVLRARVALPEAGDPDPDLRRRGDALRERAGSLRRSDPQNAITTPAAAAGGRTADGSEGPSEASRAAPATGGTEADRARDLRDRASQMRGSDP